MCLGGCGDSYILQQFLSYQAARRARPHLLFPWVVRTRDVRSYPQIGKGSGIHQRHARMHMSRRSRPPTFCEQHGSARLPIGRNVRVKSWLKQRLLDASNCQSRGISALFMPHLTESGIDFSVSEIMMCTKVESLTSACRYGCVRPPCSPKSPFTSRSKSTRSTVVWFFVVFPRNMFPGD